MADLAAARDFIWRYARLLERVRFAFLFDGGPAAAVQAALRAYQNPDGGFGNALEPDLRGPDSQPVPGECALSILDEIGRAKPVVIGRLCDWLARASTTDGGVPFVLETVTRAPHAPWWVPEPTASLNPTAGLVGLLRKLGVAHPWMEPAAAFCRRSLPDAVSDLGPDDAISVLRFLETEPDRAWSAAVLDRLRSRVLEALVALDTAAPGYVKSPLQFAPTPHAPARAFFDDATIEAHLDAVSAGQEGDGGWSITWEPPSAAAVWEWRGVVTVERLHTLRAYGRL